MTNHETIFANIANRKNTLFSYQDLEHIANKKLPDATKAGRKYAILKYIQAHCTVSDNSKEINIEREGDPRKNLKINELKKNCFEQNQVSDKTPNKLKPKTRKNSKNQTLTILKKDFLEDTAVKGFVDYLTKLIVGETDFHHSYTNKQNKKEWKCSSLQNAFQNYFWNGKSYQQNKVELDDLKKKLRDSLEIFERGNSTANNEIQFMGHCRDTLKWGGVLAHNIKWMENKISKNNLFKSFSEAKIILSNTNDLCIKSNDWNKSGQLNTCNYRMNAGYTKIYSLLCDEFIIYDSRVAAALGKLIIDFSEDNKTEISDCLKIGVMGAKGDQNRTPTNNFIKFKKIGNNGAKHAEWNIKANWILATAIKKSKMAWKDENGKLIQHKDKLRALEAALFMIGYDIPNE